LRRAPASCESTLGERQSHPPSQKRPAETNQENGQGERPTCRHCWPAGRPQRANVARNGDPNGGKTIIWPKHNSATRLTMLWDESPAGPRFENDMREE
jgi:hypothetical protein